MIRRELWSCHPSHESRSLQYVRRAWAGGVRVCSAALGGMAARGGTGYLFLPGTVDTSERETQRERGPVWGCSATLRGMAARGRAGSFCRGQGNLSIFSILYASIEWSLWYVSTVVTHPTATPPSSRSRPYGTAPATGTAARPRPWFVLSARPVARVLAVGSCTRRQRHCPLGARGSLGRARGRGDT